MSWTTITLKVPDPDVKWVVMAVVNDDGSTDLLGYMDFGKWQELANTGAELNRMFIEWLNS